MRDGTHILLQQEAGELVIFLQHLPLKDIVQIVHVFTPQRSARALTILIVVRCDDRLDVCLCVDRHSENSSFEYKLLQ